MEIKEYSVFDFIISLNLSEKSKNVWYNEESGEICFLKESNQYLKFYDFEIKLIKEVVELQKTYNTYHYQIVSNNDDIYECFVEIHRGR